jgi:hypothetical protein
MFYGQTIPKFAAALLAILGMACAHSLPTTCHSGLQLETAGDASAIGGKVEIRCQRASSCCCQAKGRVTACACTSKGEQSVPEPASSEESGRVLEWMPHVTASIMFETQDVGQCCPAADSYFSMLHPRSIQTLFCIWRI